MREFHRLLARQLRRHFGSPDQYPDELGPLIEAVNEAYVGFDADMGMLERSLELSSAELLHANSELRAIFQAFPDLLFRIDASGTILDCRGGSATDSYLPLEDLLGKQIQTIPIPDVAEAFSSALARVRETGNMVVTEYSFHRRKVEYFYEGRFIPLPDGHTIVVIRNITERKRSEQALRFSLYVIESLRNAVMWIAADSHFTYVNEATTRLLGYTTREMLGMRVPDVNPNFTPEMWEEHWQQVRDSGGAVFESSLMAKGGRWIPVEITVNPVEFEGSQYHCTFVRDITERKLAEDTRQRDEERLKRQHTSLIELGRDKDLFRGDIHLAVRRILEVAARTIDVPRASFWMLNDKRDGCLWYDAYELDSDQHAEGTNLDSGEHPVYFRTLETDRLIAARDAVNDPRAKELAEPYLIPNNISSMLNVRVVVGGHIVGVLDIEHRGELREWTADEQSFASSIAHMISMAIETSERIKTAADLHIRTSAMNAAKDQIVIVDAEGRVEFVNPSFERETGHTLAEFQGKVPGFLMSPKHPPEFYEKLWSTVRGGETWHGEITMVRKTGITVVEDVTITPIKGESGGPERYITIKRNITDKKLYEQQLDHLAHHDHLTGLPNRLLFSDRLTLQIAQAARHDRLIAVLFFDLDRFKLINDSLGHNLGDALLTAVSERVQDCLREADTIARMGGDEFTVILSDISSPDEVALVAQRLVDMLSAPFDLGGHELFVSASVGVSMYPADGRDVESLVKNADTAMYRAKEQGRNNYQFYTESLNAAAVERMQLEHSLRRALDRGEFELHYQPRVQTMTGRILGAEALLRWRHPKNGLIYPGDFIPLAEETGLISPIGEWVIRAASEQNKQWQAEGLEKITVAVNVSARQLRQNQLVDTVRQVLNETGLDPESLEIEITESAIMDNLDAAVAILRTLKDMGLKLSIDDFGTGYSSLAYLKRLPIDAIKIDQSFIRDLTTDPDDAAISQAVVAMAHSLGLTVIAEGVETLEQLRLLRTFGCDEMQGYFVSRPVPADEFADLLLGRPDLDKGGYGRRAA